MNDKFMLTPYFIGQIEPGLVSLAKNDWTINRPDLPPHESTKPTAVSDQQQMTTLFRPLASWVKQIVEHGARPVSIAGDCCAALGVMAGLQQANIQPTLIWFDAHGDFNDWDTTPSGFLGGMPLAMLAGRGEQTMLTGLSLTPIPEERIILTDARDLDPGEKTAVANSAITHLPNVEQLLDFPLPEGPLYVHFDVDVVDVADLPAVSYPTPGGPTGETLRRVFRYLAQTGRVTAVSVSTWNPVLDGNGRSRDVAMDLLAELLG
jgi:arginase